MDNYIEMIEKIEKVENIENADAENTDKAMTGTPADPRIKELEEQIADERRKFSFRLALTKAGVRSMAAAEAMTDLSSAEYDKDGCLADADGIVASLRRENPWLFDSGETVSSAPEYRERRAPDYSKMSDEEYYRYVDGENR